MGAADVVGSLEGDVGDADSTGEVDCDGSDVVDSEEELG